MSAKLAASPAADCKSCASGLGALEKQLSSESAHQLLLKKNNDYLAKVADKNSSQAIKVRSNVLVIMLRLETMKNNIEALKAEIEKKGCSQCRNL